MLNSDQQRIFDGLNSIGESVGNFYLDGVTMIDPSCILKSKANLVAHMAREIDSALREVFAPATLATSIGATLKGNSGHFASILAALGTVDTNNHLANEWHTIAKGFAGIAHRAAAHKISKDPTEMVDLWAKYEKVLLKIVGSFLNMTSRMDVLLQQDQPQASTLPAIKNITRIPRNADYFFKMLDKPEWLAAMQAEGFFDPGSVPVKLEGELTPAYWEPVRYLNTIAAKVTGADRDLLKQIVTTIMQAYIDGKIDLHPYTVSHITDVIITLDEFRFGEGEKKFFEANSIKDKHASWSMVHNDLLEKMVPKFIRVNDTTALKNFLNFFFGYTIQEQEAIRIFEDAAGKPYLQRKPNVDKTYLYQFMPLFGKQVIDAIGGEAIEIAASKLKELHELRVHPILYTAVASIEPSSQTIYSHEWEDDLIYFIRDFAPTLETDEFAKIVDDFLYSKIPILQRLAVHFIRENFMAFAEKWWEYVDTADATADPYIHEPYLLIQQHSPGFSDEQISKTINWIKMINPYGTYEYDGKVIVASAGRTLRWLSALHPASAAGKQLLQDTVAEQEKDYPFKMSEHPEFDSYGTSSVGHKIPVPVDQFELKSIEDQINFIREFRPDHALDTSEEGLGELLRHCVAKDPAKYIYKLDDFISLPSIYKHFLVDGLTKALKADKIEEYLPIIDFLEKQYVGEAYQREDEKYFYKNWLAGSVSEFLNTIISKADALGMTKEELDRCIDFTLQLITRPELQDSQEDLRNGFLHHLWNSIPGRLYGSLMSALKLYSDFAKKSGEKQLWPDNVKAFFTENLESTAPSDKEFSMMLGSELPLLLYLDSEWVALHFPSIFSTDNPAHYNYRLHTAFSQSYYPSETLYKFFKKHQLFDAALDHLKEDSGAIDTVMIYALHEWVHWKADPDNNSILAGILQRKDAGHIRRLVDVAFQRKLEPAKATALLQRLLPIFENTSGLHHSYSQLVWLIELLPELNDETVVITAKIIEKMGSSGRDAYSLLRHIYKIAGSRTKQAGQLVLMIYQKGLVNAYAERELQLLTEQIYADGEKELGDAICEAVAETGSLGLKEIYKKNNQ